MCVLVVPDEMLLQDGITREQFAREYNRQFDRYWQQQQQDQHNLVAAEREQDKSFLEMVKHQPIT